MYNFPFYEKIDIWKIKSTLNTLARPRCGDDEKETLNSKCWQRHVADLR